MLSCPAQPPLQCFDPPHCCLHPREPARRVARQQSHATLPVPQQRVEVEDARAYLGWKGVSLSLLSSMRIAPWMAPQA
jgi:hypothetical protein